ncbi:hypothetical protein FJQ87_16030 [Shewanella sp. SNU WT4]|uniref:hypothetical protein n=1 Tax=Shewanella sp. SNU WT4 TaxID=2590015 RepID=UPI00112B4EB9|nr:hypothetical protein [Shewanella sp. SNU WT4]QDF67964.1 hypothetical protein FJQ87_16030 [Shewanella sp. SNU WT4]
MDSQSPPVVIAKRIVTIKPRLLAWALIALVLSYLSVLGFNLLMPLGYAILLVFTAAFTACAFYLAHCAKNHLVHIQQDDRCDGGSN